MSDDPRFEQDAPAEGATEDYAAPRLNDLGSFEELTQNNPGPFGGDAEGAS